MHDSRKAPFVDHLNVRSHVDARVDGRWFNRAVGGEAEVLLSEEELVHPLALGADRPQLGQTQGSYHRPWDSFDHAYRDRHGKSVQDVFGQELPNLGLLRLGGLVVSPCEHGRHLPPPFGRVEVAVKDVVHSFGQELGELGELRVLPQ